MMTWVMSDRAIPRSYRMMQGFGVHTFVLVNAEGKRTFVKFHWRPLLGVHGLVWDEAMKLGGVDPDYHRRDLYEAIENGDFPEFELGFQCVNEEDEHKFDFDLLDPTKLISEELVKIEVGDQRASPAHPLNSHSTSLSFHAVADLPPWFSPGRSFSTSAR